MLDVDRLRRVLTERGTTQVAAAVAMGIDRGHLNDILHGRVQRPGIKVMEALRRAYPDDYDQIVVWVDPDGQPVPAGAGEAR